MNKITVGKLFELYLDTLDKCSESTKNLSDEMIEYNIFEEFIVGVTSFLANNSLNDLLDNGLIDEQLFSDSKELRRLTLKLDGSNQWNVSSFRNAESWKDIIALSDKIKQQIQQKWNEKEIQEIFEL
ncbi:hypothetical protein [Lacrimispora sp.]|uniref:hypothetical protein n=1 Tax=Lacrimispora sp. TaxID=2719234 RepID=UPI0028AA7B70|nr:hypothetical protein [Lacrimispora sp.]